MCAEILDHFGKIVEGLPEGLTDTNFTDSVLNNPELSADDLIDCPRPDFAHSILTHSTIVADLVALHIHGCHSKHGCIYS